MVATTFGEKVSVLPNQEVVLVIPLTLTTPNQVDLKPTKEGV